LGATGGGPTAAAKPQAPAKKSSIDYPHVSNFRTRRIAAEVSDLWKSDQVVEAEGITSPEKIVRRRAI